jgi:hypothetical protein
MKTWNDMSELEQAQVTYYELFKDVYGFRDHSGKSLTWTLDKLRSEMDRLHLELQRVEEEELRLQAVSIEKFETRVANTIKSGARDRATALRWIFDAQDEYSRSDPDYFCYCNGLPYGYFKEAA